MRTAGDWEVGVDFFLGGVELIAGDAVRKAKKLAALFHQDGEKIQTLGCIAFTILRVFQVLCKWPLLKNIKPNA